MLSTEFLWYGLTAAIIALMGYFPSRRYLYLVRIVKLERALGRETTREEKLAAARATRSGGWLVVFSMTVAAWLLLNGWRGVP